MLASVKSKKPSGRCQSLGGPANTRSERTDGIANRTAMNDGTVESVELAIDRWRRDGRGRHFVVSSSFRPPSSL